jgi:hypothetical protein
MYMAEEKNIRDIADSSVPNAGRIYDYLLGGNHNFEIDRHIAEKILQVAPFMSEYFRLIRWFLGEATRRLCDEGFDKFLDFASGLPTVDHIHQIAPKGTKVIYSDNDPVTVAYANDIIGEDPNIRYVICNAEKPEELLNSGLVEDVFGSDRRVAIGFNGIAWFIQDNEVARSLKVLYDWADNGSKLFICDTDGDVSTESEDGLKLIEMYEKIGHPLYIRPIKRTIELIGPWTILEPGFESVEDWVGIDKTFTEKITKAWGSGVLKGAILKK